MSDFIQVVFALGGFAAAVAVGLMCGICLLVWLGGGERKPPTETWRPADEL